MATSVIHIFGASGSGTSRLGSYISERLGYTFMDTDDYYWKPTNPPYKEARPVSERLELMKSRIAKSGDVVISGSLSGWGDGLIPLFMLAVRLVTDCAIRLERLKKREKEKFGVRIETGGDMFEEHKAFLAWAAEYDSGDRTIRSKARHDEWQKLLTCPLIVLNGSAPVEDNFEKIRIALKR